MGGDLVDLVQDGNTWIGYLADVCGHGVPSGVLMAMVKSAVRMRVATSSEPQAQPGQDTSVDYRRCVVCHEGVEVRFHAHRQLGPQQTR
jgi:hypothetical protein